MNVLTTTLKADNMAVAEVTSTSDHHVTLKIDQEDKWDAVGLLKLSAMLKGVAATLEA